MAFPDNYKNYVAHQNYRLPGQVAPYWSYNNESWSTVPLSIISKAKTNNYTTMKDYNIDMSKDWFSWLKEQKTISYPIEYVHGGLTAQENNVIVNATNIYPDIRSETEYNKKLFQDYFNMVYKKNPKMFQDFSYKY